MQPDFKHFIRICDNINRTITRIPHKAAVLAVNFSKERFIKKNWLDDREYPWPKTKKRKGSTLIKSGRLKRSIRQVHVGADYAIIGTDVPYARAHSVKSHTRKIKRSFAQRQFIGQSKYLSDKIAEMIQTELNRAIQL